MTNLKGSVVRQEALTKSDKEVMYALMDTFYDNMTKENFLRDLEEKDYCIVLRDETGHIGGFSTQKLLHIPVGDTMMHGVFSGDTIIHKDYWGSMALFIEFAKFFFQFEEVYGEFYWFLICKGYKTYKLLPTFFNTFYPNYKLVTPVSIKEKMDAYGMYCFPEDYDPQTGVICYKQQKDRLKEHVADITEDKLKDEHIAYFVKHNPEYIKGNDIVCITQISKDNLSKRAVRFLFQQ